MLFKVSHESLLIQTSGGIPLHFSHLVYLHGTSCARMCKQTTSIYFHFNDLLEHFILNLHIFPP